MINEGGAGDGLSSEPEAGGSGDRTSGATQPSDGELSMLISPSGTLLNVLCTSKTADHTLKALVDFTGDLIKGRVASDDREHCLRIDG